MTAAAAIAHDRLRLARSVLQAHWPGPWWRAWLTTVLSLVHVLFGRRRRVVMRVEATPAAVPSEATVAAIIRREWGLRQWLSWGQAQRHQLLLRQSVAAYHAQGGASACYASDN